MGCNFAIGSWLQFGFRSEVLLMETSKLYTLKRI